tara:strand:+ start:2031 stop:2237 length:207 start_codon:yes stop_codon:yes gene_type:complete
MKYANKEYPKAGNKRPKKATVNSMKASNKGYAQAKTCKVSTVSELGKQKKIKGVGAATKGTSFTSYIN